MGAGVHISMSFGNGLTMQKFGQVIQERMKWMRETARDSIAACAITALKAIRTITRVAKLSSIKVEVTPDSTLYPSFTSKGSQKIPCVRFKGSKQRYSGRERLRIVGKPAKIEQCLVYRFTDKLSNSLPTYFIIAESPAAAKAEAKAIVRSRQIRYAGLAKRAIGVLMHKTSTNQNPKDNVPMRVNAKAVEVTKAKEIVAKSTDGNGGKYALVMHDDLKYATDSIKGGRSAVDIQMKKAMNKIISIVNRKIQDGATFFSSKKIPTPFPALVRRRNN